MSDSSRSHGLQPTRLLPPWDFPGKSTGVGCHGLLCDPTELSKCHGGTTWSKSREAEEVCVHECVCDGVCVCVCVCMCVCVHVYDMCSGVCVCMVGVWYMHVHDVGFHMCVTCV